ncbi:MAG: hypothetical protein PHF31_06735 [Methylobacter sp.]|nr:hypothetical protein [Methylobacter sp.]
MSNLLKDIIFGLMFLTGLFGFISGAFIVSSALFASAAIFSNIDFNNRLLG